MSELKCDNPKVAAEHSVWEHSLEGHGQDPNSGSDNTGCVPLGYCFSVTSSAEWRFIIAHILLLWWLNG